MTSKKKTTTKTDSAPTSDSVPTEHRTPMNPDILRRMKPKEALARLKAGNARFVSEPRDRKKKDKFINASKDGQYPFAIVLSCVDSRIPTEVIFDQEIGDIFNARIAGNFVNEDILGSMEFAAGYVKSIVVLGHTACGAIGAACTAVYPLPPAKDCKEDDRKEETGETPSNLLQMVGKLVPAVVSTPVNTNRIKSACANSGFRTDFVNTVARTNVRQTIRDILIKSDFLRQKAVTREILIRGAMYDIQTGKVEFLDEEKVEASNAKIS